MKRYSFRLETVLRVRRTQEELARAAMATATAAVAADERELVRRRATYEAGVSAHTSAPCADFLFEQERRSTLGAAVRHQQGRLEQTRSAATSAQAAWTAAAAQVSGLERLDDRHRADHRRANDREDEQMTDELVTSRHGRELR